jgi:hypothetical protein
MRGIRFSECCTHLYVVRHEEITGTVPAAVGITAGTRQR